jgi:hypothetical protein
MNTIVDAENSAERKDIYLNSLYREFAEALIDQGSVELRSVSPAYV